MAKIKNLHAAIVREPETAGAKIERKGPNGSDEEASPTPKTAGAFPKSKSLLAEPFHARRSDARSVAGNTPRPTEKPGE